MNLNKIQKELLNTCDNKVTIVANRRCSGQTTGLMLKALTHQSDVYFCVPNYRNLNSSVDYFSKMLSDLNISSYKYHATTTTFHKDYHKIKFCTQGFNYPDGSLILIDQVEMFDPKFIESLLDHHSNLETNSKFIFTTQPFHCGWRDFKFENGSLSLDEKGDYKIVNKSWDYDLVNWGEKSLKSRAEVEDYKPFVKIINFPEEGVENNYLDKIIDDLNPSDKERINGVWKNGWL